MADPNTPSSGSCMCEISAAPRTVAWLVHVHGYVHVHVEDREIHTHACAIPCKRAALQPVAAM